jgi:hypothetical protein
MNPSLIHYDALHGNLAITDHPEAIIASDRKSQQGWRHRINLLNGKMISA